MISVAENYCHVVGVDTHAKTHTFTIVDAPTGRVVISHTFATSVAGINRSLGWVSRHAPTDPLMVIEGIGSYGAILAEYAHRAGFTVVEPNTIPANVKYGTGKSDDLDAYRIAHSVLATPLTHLRRPRSDGGIRDALRVLITTRTTLNNEKTRAANQLLALLRLTELGIDARGKLTRKMLTTVSAWRTRNEPIAIHITRVEARRLAQRITNLTTDLVTNQATITGLITTSEYALLLDEPGVGPISAAIIILAWGNPDRIRSEASFAALAGVSPIPASSGNTTRYRLNRGGDRQLNKALTTIVNTRLKNDPTTQAYRDRRTGQGMTKRSVTRILKRYIARHLYRILTTIPT